jgi:large subunit ribosomal protein L18
MNTKREKIVQRKLRVRAKVKGTEKRPRLSVFRSNKGIYAQIIDDESGKTLVSVSFTDKGVKKTKTSKTEVAFLVGEALAVKALKAKIKKVVFDKGAYKYHGRVEKLAEGARKGGLDF